MKSIRMVLAMVAMLAITSVASANKYPDTIALFKNAGESATFFDSCYGYAVFPTIGKGGLIVGAAHGKGHVYEKGKYRGNTAVTQLSVGFQAGGQAYSEIIFFEDKRALDEFIKGNFEFEADASAVAITAAASGTAGTTGASAGASGGKRDATTAGGSYYKGMKVFTIVKGGAMYEASLAGQKFTFEPKDKATAE
ncbi:MAG TPA: lipid-binding SYLF domain-containing protein [Steroidobacteraceae bacterium]|nr:lipid-binding SYLF domain-containing protein [Steroidobacteraceae bacterium]